MSVAVIDLNSSPNRCSGPPVPDEPKVSLPGLSLANAISSFTDLAGNPGWTMSRSCPVVVRLTAAKSSMGSKGSFVDRLGAITNELAMSSNV